MPDYLYAHGGQLLPYPPPRRANLKAVGHPDVNDARIDVANAGIVANVQFGAKHAL